MHDGEEAALCPQKHATPAPLLEDLTTQMRGALLASVRADGARCRRHVAGRQRVRERADDESKSTQALCRNKHPVFLHDLVQLGIVVRISFPVHKANVKLHAAGNAHAARRVELEQRHPRRVDLLCEDIEETFPCPFDLKLRLLLRPVFFTIRLCKVLVACLSLSGELDEFGVLGTQHPGSLAADLHRAAIFGSLEWELIMVFVVRCVAEDLVVVADDA